MTYTLTIDLSGTSGESERLKMIADVLSTASSEATYARIYKKGVTELEATVTTFDGYLGKVRVAA